MFRIIKRTIGLALLVVIVLPLYAGGKVWYTANHTNPVKSDAIIVLGAAQFDGVPSPVLEARLIEAKRIFAQKLAPRILTVGSRAPGDRTTEAASGFYWLVDHGVGRKYVDSIPYGRDTLASTESYVEVMKKLNLKSAIIVTDQYHCLRAITMAEDLKISATCAPTRTGPASTTNSSFRYLARETAAYLAYVTVGRHGIHLTDQVKN
ncbi:MAG: YdcF family protein [Actinobacteria bacterium]|nr:YdcF family protein [Actinomycetota bacterium]